MVTVRNSEVEATRTPLNIELIFGVVVGLQNMPLSINMFSWNLKCQWLLFEISI
jgi:hypothetical protein